MERYIVGFHPNMGQLSAIMLMIERFHQLTQKLPQRPGFASSQELLRLDHGGDVNLRAMPDLLVERCRSIWSNYVGNAQSVVHGDLNQSNILITPEGKVCLVDWDEARVDISLFDSIALSKMFGRNLTEASQRLLRSWEVAVCWHIEPEHARLMMAKL